MKRDKKNKSFGIKKETKEAHIELQGYGVSMKSLLQQNTASQTSLYPPLRQSIRQYIPFSEDPQSLDLEAVANEIVEFSKTQRRGDFKLLFQKAKVQPSLLQLKQQYIEDLVGGYFTLEFPNELREKQLKKRKLKKRKAELTDALNSLSKKQRKGEKTGSIQNLAENVREVKDQKQSEGEEGPGYQAQSEESFSGSLFGEESEVEVESQEGGEQVI